MLYIDTLYLTENTNLSQNIDTAVLGPNIQKAQDIYISKFLGKPLDDYLQNAILTGMTTPTDTNLNILIKKTLAEFSAYCAYVDVLFKMMNKGLLNGSSNNGVVVSRNDMIYVRDISKSQAEFYLNEVKLFLDENEAEYVGLWNKCSNNQVSSKFPIIF